MTISAYSVLTAEPNGDTVNERVIWQGGEEHRCLEIAQKFREQRKETYAIQNVPYKWLDEGANGAYAKKLLEANNVK